MFKRIFSFSLLILSLTLLLTLYLSNKVKSEVHSETGMYYQISHNPSFPKVDGTIRDMALNADGSILYVGGDFSEIGEVGTEATYPRSNLAAISTSDYSVTSWAPQADGTVYAIEIYGSSIYVGGSFHNINEVFTGEFAEIYPNGTLNIDCDPEIETYSGPATVYDISITSEYIYVAGSFNKIVDDGGSIDQVYGLARLANTSSCSWDNSWKPMPVDYYDETFELGTVYDVETFNGNVYIGGSFNYVDEIYTGEFAKINSDGTANTDCDPNIHTYVEQQATSKVYELSITDDYIYVGGSFNRVNDDFNEVTGLVRLANTNSCTWDDSWVPELLRYDSSPSTVYTISPVQDDVFVGGSFHNIGGLEDTEFALIDGLSGATIQYWNPMIKNIVLATVYSSIALNGELYVGGSFNSVSGMEDYIDYGYGLASFTYSYDAIPTIQIQTIEDLDSVRDNLLVNYILMNDLDFTDEDSYSDPDNMTQYTTGEGWDPIGSYENPFLGVFNGQGYTISGLYINQFGEDVGLFGAAGESSQITDLGILNSNITGGGYVGAIVGSSWGTIERSYGKGTVSGEYCIGGLVGAHSMPSNYELGIPPLETFTIRDSYSEVDVSGDEGIGGLVGCNEGDIFDSYSIGEVTGNEGVGGLIGYYDDGEISNSYWDTDTSGILVSDGGLGLTTENMQSLITYTGWDIVEMNNFDPSDPTVWYISDGDDYPRLYWEYEAPEVLTKAATNFTIDGATLNGELLSMDGETEVSVSFRYRQGEGEWTNVNAISKTATGVFSSSITGLTLNTQYQYQTIVTWREVGTVYGNIVSFTTPETPPLPTVFGPVVSNIEDIQNPDDTEVPLVLTKIGTGSITFPSGLNLTDNYEQLSNLSENLVIIYEPSLNRYRAYVNSNGASFLATNGATIRFFNVRSQLGITGLTSSNFKTLLKVSVLDDIKNVVGDTSSYYDWNNASYNQDTDILTMPVNHFSEYVLGVNTGVLPSTGMSSLTMLVPFGLSILGVGIIVISKKKTQK